MRAPRQTGIQQKTRRRLHNGPRHHIDAGFPFEIIAHLSEIDGKPYVEILTERAFLRGVFHGGDEQPLLRLFVNDEQVIDWPGQVRLA